MPSYTDPSTGKRIRSDEPLSDADLEEAFGGSTSSQPGALARAGQYLLKRGGDFAGAIGRLSGFGEEMGATGPGAPMPEVSPGQAAADVATLAGPVVAPYATAAGTALGAGAAAAGADEGTAEMADIAGTVAGGVVGAGRGIARAVTKTKNVIPAGEKLGAAVPGMRQAVSAERAAKFDPVIEFLDRSGRTLTAGSSGGEKLGKALLEAQDDWGMLATGGEKRVVADILDRLTSGVPVGARDLDDALKVVNRSGKAFATRRALVQGLDELAQGTPAAGKLSAAGREYHRILKPGMAFAQSIGGAKTPQDAAMRAARTWHKLSPETQALVDPSGEVAGLIHEATRAMPRGGLSGGMAAWGGGAGAAGYAFSRFSEGDVAGGFKALLGVPVAAAVRRPGMIGPITRAAAGPLAGAATSVGPRVAEGLAEAATPSPTPEMAPEPTEAQGAPEEPGVAPEPQAAARTPQGPWGREIQAVSEIAGIPPRLMQVIMKRESTNPQWRQGGNPNALSEAGAVGPMQLMPPTFEGLRPQLEQHLGRRANIHNPLDNLLAGALYLRQGLDRSNGSVEGAARYYHGGPDTRIHGPINRAYREGITSAFGSGR